MHGPGGTFEGMGRTAGGALVIATALWVGAAQDPAHSGWTPWFIAGAFVTSAAALVLGIASFVQWWRNREAEPPSERPSSVGTRAERSEVFDKNVQTTGFDVGYEARDSKIRREDSHVEGPDDAD